MSFTLVKGNMKYLSNTAADPKTGLCDAATEIRKKLKSIKKKSFNILLVGMTGVGKSSLTNR